MSFGRVFKFELLDINTAKYSAEMYDKIYDTYNVELTNLFDNGIFIKYTPLMWNIENPISFANKNNDTCFIIPDIDIELDINPPFVYVEHEEIISFIDEDILFKIVEIMKEFGIVFSKFEDITEKIILENFEDLEKFMQINYNFIEQYKISTLTVDAILDKINKYGIESLTIIDKQILKTN